MKSMILKQSRRLPDRLDYPFEGAPHVHREAAAAAGTDPLDDASGVRVTGASRCNGQRVRIRIVRKCVLGQTACADGCFQARLGVLFSLCTFLGRFPGCPGPTMVRMNLDRFGENSALQSTPRGRDRFSGIFGEVSRMHGTMVRIKLGRIAVPAARKLSPTDQSSCHVVARSFSGLSLPDSTAPC